MPRLAAIVEAFEAVTSVTDLPLESLLSVLLARLDETWGQWGPIPPAFFGHLGSHCPSADAAQYLQSVAIEDLYLAWTCAQGHPRAAARLQRDFFRDADLAVASLGIPPDGVAEIQQAVLTDLVVARAPAPPKILAYAGRGPLRRWLRVVAVRRATLRSAARTDDSEFIERLADGCIGPELAEIRDDGQAHLKRAFQAAMAALEPEQRLLLRQSVLDGLSIDALGRMHGVHRATAARRLARARQTLLEGIRGELRDRLGLPPASTAPHSCGGASQAANVSSRADRVKALARLLLACDISIDFFFPPRRSWPHPRT